MKNKWICAVTFAFILCLCGASMLYAAENHNAPQSESVQTVCVEDSFNGRFFRVCLGDSGAIPGTEGPFSH
ncbi:MAG: hypothetical protein IJT16_00990 [Lachnospiraceae bacterium]|nr:hypothetical protein [Lachnospiraceae bacterium]